MAADYSNLAVPSTEVGGLLGSSLHVTTRGFIDAGYIVLGVALGIVGIVLVVGGINETRNLISSVAKVAPLAA